MRKNSSKKSRQSDRKKLVTITGGTGGYTLLSGLKGLPFDISAIVSMADDGGSTGELRDKWGALPPGDVRQCLAALSPAENDIRELMSHRAEKGPFRGHTFGNVFLSWLQEMHGDSFYEAVQSASRVLNIAGEVIPVTLDDARLAARLSDGTVIYGEDEIEKTDLQTSGFDKLFYESKVRANREALERIREADGIVLGPGSLYESVLSNLVVPGVSDAVARSEAKVIFIVNLTNKRGHTSGWSVERHVEEVEKFIGKGRVNYVLVNTKNPPQSLLARYQKQEGEDALVKCGECGIKSERKVCTYRVVKGDLMNGTLPRESKSDPKAALRSFIRHDPSKLARAVHFIVDFVEGGYTVV